MHHCRVAFASLSRLSRCIIAVILVVGSLVLIPSPVVRAAAITANVFSDPTPGDCATSGSGNCSLREAVIYGNAHPGSTIMLLAGTYLLTIPPDEYNMYATGTIYVRADMTFIGQGASATAVDGSGMPSTQRDRVFTIYNANIPSEPTVAMSGLTIRGGWGGIDSSGPLSLTDCVIRNNDVPRNIGGGLVVSAPTTLLRTVVTQNSAYSGGGIHVGNFQPFTLTDSEVSHNVALTGQGGGIDTYGPLTVTNSIIKGNSATTQGGGIDTICGKLTVTNTIIGGAGTDGNVAGEEGGGIASNCSGTDITLQSSHIVGNQAHAATSLVEGGGGIWAFYGYVNIYDSEIANNVTDGDGGGIHQNRAIVVVERSTIHDNRSQKNGGGIYASAYLRDRTE